MKERIEAIRGYLKYYPNDASANNNLIICTCADELGMELTGGYYPRAEYGYCCVNRQIKVGKKYHLTNRTTGYEFNGKDNIVIWSESCGRLAFVNDNYYHTVDDEWKEFIDTIKSYEPLDYDEINNDFVFDIEHGKRLIKDYDGIVRVFMNKAKKKIEDAKMEKKRAEFERLKKELES